MVIDPKISSLPSPHTRVANAMVELAVGAFTEVGSRLGPGKTCLNRVSLGQWYF